MVDKQLRPVHVLVTIREKIDNTRIEDMPVVYQGAHVVHDSNYYLTVPANILSAHKTYIWNIKELEYKDVQ